MGPKNSVQIPAIPARAQNGQGLTPAEAATLLGTADPAHWETVFQIAAKLKKRIYGNRIVIFAPLYLSNHCINHCTYCGYHQGSSIERPSINPGADCRRG